MALVLTLAIIVILSVLLVSFMSMISLDRGATKSYGQSMQAEQIAMGGLDQLVSQLQAEIADPAFSTNYPAVVGGITNNLYVSGSYAVPQRTAPNLPNLATLLSYSGTNLYTIGSGATNYTSNSSTGAKSVNGRSISMARWNKPQLTTGTDGFPVPQWILMTRSGPQSANSFNSNLASNAARNDNYVVGRYAYTVYDTSGLLDANVAGYPSSVGSAITGGKGLMPWADLTQLGSVITSDKIDKFVNWRNATTAATYAASVLTTATTNGFTRVVKGDTCFLSRQELIKYAQTQNPDFVSILPYLTTFSRELNGPTWGPTTPAGSLKPYGELQYTAGELNPRIPIPRVTKTFTRNNGLPAVLGEPLVKYRFPLGKLALLEKFTGKNKGTLSDAEISDIQKYFGLDYAPDSNGPTYRRWIYPTQNRPALSSTNAILSLDEVATLGREPDFFELLQAGILAGSLGIPGKDASGQPNLGRSDQRPANTNGAINFIDPDDISTLQILRIGANIIDQWDADSYPTTITLRDPEISVYGIEDLPYPFAAFLNVYAADPTTPPFKFYVYFELWNPHQVPSRASSYPQEFILSPFYNNSLTDDRDSFKAGFNGSGGTWFCSGSTPNVTPQYLGDPNKPQQIS
jgi:hypothetical protein